MVVKNFVSWAQILYNSLRTDMVVVTVLLALHQCVSLLPRFLLIKLIRGEIDATWNFGQGCLHLVPDGFEGHRRWAGHCFVLAVLPLMARPAKLLLFMLLVLFRLNFLKCTLHIFNQNLHLIMLCGADDTATFRVVASKMLFVLIPTEHVALKLIL